MYHTLFGRCLIAFRSRSCTRTGGKAKEACDFIPTTTTT